MNSHINNGEKPLIFLGSNDAMYILTEACEQLGIKFAGIIDKDFYGNRDYICDVPVIDSEESFNDPEKLAYYKNNFNFFCATNWIPEPTPVHIRNREKRLMLLDLLDTHKLNCISIVHPKSNVSRHAEIHPGVYIDAHVNVEPKVVVGAHSRIMYLTAIAHNTIIGRNCVFSRHCGIGAYCVFEDNVFFGNASKGLKNGATFSENTFVHEGVYIRRGTVQNEVVSMISPNQRRVVHYINEEM